MYIDLLRRNTPLTLQASSVYIFMYVNVHIHVCMYVCIYIDYVHFYTILCLYEHYTQTYIYT